MRDHGSSLTCHNRSMTQCKQMISNIHLIHLTYFRMISSSEFGEQRREPDLTPPPDHNEDHRKPPARSQPLRPSRPGSIWDINNGATLRAASRVDPNQMRCRLSPVFWSGGGIGGKVQLRKSGYNWYYIHFLVH